ncbi:MAG TPA: hypothetical protein VIA11_11000 [Acidimicrobiia bacterium]|jgi:hypothetical protein|nr:hypothetical protein [Acidimicrobiia bacterium]
MARTVVVCRKCKHHECLTDILETRTDVSVRLVKCQKICHGPVVGLPVAGRMEWFERVNGVKQIAALLLLTTKGNHDAVPKALKKRRVKGYAGHSPRT